MTALDPADHIPEAVHGMDGYDQIYCSCGWDSDSPKAGGWLDHLPDSLDTAWAEAEAALPEGWVVGGLHRNVEGHGRTPQQAWWVSTYRHGGAPLPIENVAGDPPRWRDPRYQQIAYGPTPAAALRALAVKLREVGR